MKLKIFDMYGVIIKESKGNFIHTHLVNLMNVNMKKLQIFSRLKSYLTKREKVK